MPPLPLETLCAPPLPPPYASPPAVAAAPHPSASVLRRATAACPSRALLSSSPAPLPLLHGRVGGTVSLKDSARLRIPGLHQHQRDSSQSGARMGRFAHPSPSIALTLLFPKMLGIVGQVIRG